jgi:hypothetical protein
VSLEDNFDRVMNSFYSHDLPPVEIVTDSFRGVAKNFFALPMKLLIDLKHAREDQDGSDFHLLLDACEMAFSVDDYNRIEDLSIQDFLYVVQVWVSNSHRLGTS